MFQSWAAGNAAAQSAPHLIPGGLGPCLSEAQRPLHAQPGPQSYSLLSRLWRIGHAKHVRPLHAFLLQALNAHIPKCHCRHADIAGKGSMLPMYGILGLRALRLQSVDGSRQMGDGLMEKSGYCLIEKSYQSKLQCVPVRVHCWRASHHCSIACSSCSNSLNRGHRSAPSHAKKERLGLPSG